MNFPKSNSRATRYLLFLSISVALALVMISVVSGRAFRLAKIPDGGKNFGCITCHTTSRGGTLNAFGKDYERIAMKAGDTYSAELGKLDSDGDGANNDQEFQAKTNPGDPKSNPGSAVASTTGATAANAEAELTKALNRGKTLFSDAKLGKTGSSCNTCHLGGKTTGGRAMEMTIPSLEGIAGTFPKYKSSAKDVITLQMMNNICIEKIMKGKPLALDSKDSIALVAYVTFLSNDAKIQVGGK